MMIEREDLASTFCHSEPFDFAQNGLRRGAERVGERHERLRRKGSGERVGRRASSISYYRFQMTMRDLSTALHFVALCSR